LGLEGILFIIPAWRDFCMSILDITPIDGLYIESNLYTASDDGTYYTIIASEGPGVTDVVTHGPEFKYRHYGIHVAQTDRLTFFGDMKRTIAGHFVDCRAGSATLHKYVMLEFAPDPTRKLYIGRGIAHTFDGLEDIVTRDEPEWFISRGNPDYNIANDVINVPRDTDLDEFPSVQINEFPIPRKAYEFMLKVQHFSMAELHRYPSRFPITIGGRKRYVSLRPKAHQKGK
jgi:hypothetical protein